MNRMYLAAVAIAATAAVAATPLLAQSAGNPPGSPANPGATVPLSESGQSYGAPSMPGRWGMEQGMQQRGPGAMPWKTMMGHGGMQHRMMARSPQAWCIERLARRAGLRAYIETKLNLTPAQMPLWRKVQDAANAETQQERQLCDALKPGAATALERLDRREQFLSVRLAGLKAVRPALDALYKSLTPEQKQIIDHPFRMP